MNPLLQLFGRQRLAGPPCTQWMGAQVNRPLERGEGLVRLSSKGGPMASHGRFGIVFFAGTVIVSVCMLFAAATESFARSRSYCEGYARDYANRNSYYGTRGGALGGAARGAAGGALFGAIAGNAGTGAAIGAGVGAITGGARRANSWQYYYDRAYSDCIRGR